MDDINAQQIRTLEEFLALSGQTIEDAENLIEEASGNLEVTESNIEETEAARDTAA